MMTDLLKSLPVAVVCLIAVVRLWKQYTQLNEKLMESFTRNGEVIAENSAAMREHTDAIHDLRHAITGSRNGKAA